MKQATRPHSPSASDRSGTSAAHRTKSRAAGPRVPEASRQAKRVAASVLEVLAGSSSPATAAAALEVSLPRYYLLEQRAIEGLVAACEPRSGGGPALSPGRQVDALRKQIERLQRECTRHQALWRAAQRTIGLVALAPTGAKAKSADKKKRKRRPSARALVAARALQADSEGPTQTPPSTPDTGDLAGARAVSCDSTVLGTAPLSSSDGLQQ